MAIDLVAAAAAAAAVAAEKACLPRSLTACHRLSFASFLSFGRANASVVPPAA